MVRSPVVTHTNERRLSRTPARATKCPSNDEYYTFIFRVSCSRYEPYMPQLQPLLEVGGVMVIRGREGLGAKELEDYIRDFGEELW